MTPPQTIPLLPCADIDVIESFFATLGFTTTFRQHRPYASLALRGHEIDLQYYGLPGHTPESSHSSCIVIVDDTAPIWEAFANGLRASYGRVPITGFPRITRPRPRKNAGGLSGFSLIDPAGNWLRFFNRPQPETGNGDAHAGDVGTAPHVPPRDSPSSPSRLGEAILNAVVLADSKGDVPQATKVLAGAIRRAPGDDPALSEAQELLTELRARHD